LWLSADSSYFAVRLGFRHHHFVLWHRDNQASQPTLNRFLRQRSARGSARPPAVQPGIAQITTTAQHDSLGRMVNVNDSDGKANKGSSG
jgi:hypothetical protein